MALGVYAVTAGGTPNPGHPTSQIAPPAPCTSGQAITSNGTDFICSNSAVENQPIYNCVGPDGSQITQSTDTITAYGGCLLAGHLVN